MIRKDGERIVSGGADDEVSPGLEALNNCQEFFVVDIVVGFGGQQFTGMIRDGMENTRHVSL